MSKRESRPSLGSWWRVDGNAEWVGVALTLAMVAIAGRFLVDWPNFKPAIAAALMAGLLLRDGRWTVPIVLLPMALTDIWYGTYAWPVMVAVYVSLLLPAVGYPTLHDRLERIWAGWSLGGRMAATWGMLNVAAVGAAILFWVATSTAVCLATPWHPTTWEGLAQSHVAALPFLRWMIQGNWVFTNLLLVGWWAYRAGTLAWRENRELAPQ